MNYLKPEEMLKVLEVAQATGAREHAMILLGYRHGMRRSEISELTLNDIQGDKIVIRRKKGSLKTTQPLATHENPLLDEVAVLNKWLAERGDADGSSFVFTSRQGSAVKHRRIYDIFSAIAEKAGIDESRRNPHILKHSLASNLLRAGVSVAYVQIALGHADAKNTMRYMNVTDEEAGVETAKSMDAIFAGGAA